MVRKIKYTQPQAQYWVKLIVTPPMDERYGLKEGEVFQVMQYVETNGRNAGIATLRIKCKTGELIGLLPHEFINCDQFGNPI